MRTDNSVDAELIGIGIGPGDPGMVTLEAARVLGQVDVIFAPTAPTKERSLAADIARDAGADASKIRPLPFPMTRDKSALTDAWSKAAAEVIRAMDAGSRVGFITLGDPSVYSTWIYLRRAVEHDRPGTRIAVVPGIMAMTAAAAAAGIGLVEGDERLALVPLPKSLDDLAALVPLFPLLVVYKIGGRLAELAQWLRAHDLTEGAWLVSGVGLERERVQRFMEQPQTEDGYLSVALIRTRVKPCA